MAMTYTSLLASKGTAGALATWIAYSKADLPTILDEAQALLYMELRILEMRTSAQLYLPIGAADLTLPSGFIEPIGGLWCQSINREIRQRDLNDVKNKRIFNETTGTLGTNPLTTTSGSTAITVNFPGHGFTNYGGGSAFSLQGATAVGGITPNGAYYLTGIVDANNFTIDNRNVAPTATSSASGGGSSITYLSDQIQPGIPQIFAINSITNAMFDWATSQALNLYLNYYQTLPLLSGTNPTNVLTTRYPQLLRKACMVSAAEFMDDDAAAQRLMSNPVTGLTALIQRVNAENERFMSGIEIYTDTPGTGGGAW
jgi:hypothetical protein